MIESLFGDKQTSNQIKEALLSFSQYDLKEQFPFDLYPERTVFGKSIASDFLKGNKVKAYLCYKALTIADKKGEFSNRAASIFDPDNSGGTCDFAKDLYADLWGFEYKYSKFGKIDAFPDEENRIMLWGGDCLNSMQTSIYAATSYSKLNCLRKLSEDEDKIISELEKSEISPMFYVSHAPGNFGLVPAYFNGYRGLSPLIHDYLPQSLFFLKTNNNYSLVESLSAYTRIPKYKNGEAKKYFQEYSPAMFGKYVNTMFLWDLVQYDDSGNINVFDYAGNVIDSLCNEFYEPDLSAWANGAAKFIKRRGIFMAALLYTCHFHKNEFDKLIQMIYVDEVIKVDTMYGYDAVFRLIEENINKDCVKHIFKCVEELFYIEMKKY